MPRRQQAERTPLPIAHLKARVLGRPAAPDTLVVISEANQAGRHEAVVKVMDTLQRIRQRRRTVGQERRRLEPGGDRRRLAAARGRSRPPGRGPGSAGIALSLLVHAGLVVAIAFGVSWRSHTPEARRPSCRAAVPRRQPRRRAVEPIPPPAGNPPRPALPVVASHRRKVVVEVPDAKIAIEKARKGQQAQKQQKAAEQERKRAAAEAEREARRSGAARRRDGKQEQAAEPARRAAARSGRARRTCSDIRGLAGASGDRLATGTGAASAGPSGELRRTHQARIRPNIVLLTRSPAIRAARSNCARPRRHDPRRRSSSKAAACRPRDNAVARDKTRPRRCTCATWTAACRRRCCWCFVCATGPAPGAARGRP